MEQGQMRRGGISLNRARGELLSHFHVLIQFYAFSVLQVLGFGVMMA